MKRKLPTLIEIEIIRIPKNSVVQKKQPEKQRVELETLGCANTLEKTVSVWNIFSTNFLKKLSRNLGLS